ncbi:putative G-protein coupled receptor 21 [Amphibalanus amphitrite]|uniref:Putative G-protein coupled receptor 21 n=1 Tax=Amphibalanus amphitrite TaxID=1232801 RepID=A0A6A4W8S6_AMPAM|nr:putative G-protein coupled receptor 21 [Amphibalanus amphitrite]
MNYVGLVVGLLIALSSLLPCLAIGTSRSLRRRPMFQLLLHLASSGVLFGLLTALSGLLRLLHVPLPVPLCQTLLAGQTAVGLASMAALAAVSVERYVAVEHGLRYFELMTPARLRLLHGAVPAVSALSLLVHATDRAPGALRPPDGVQCYYLDFWSDQLEQIHLGFGVTLVTFIMVLNLLVGARGIEQDRRIRRQRGGMLVAHQRPGSAGDHKALYAVLRLSVFSIALQMPHFCISTLHFVTGKEMLAARRLAGAIRLLMFLLNGSLFGY